MRYGDRADGSDRLTVEKRIPRDATVVGLPYAAPYAAKVINVRLAFHSSHGDAASATVRPNHPPAQAVIKIGIELLGKCEAG